MAHCVGLIQKKIYVSIFESIPNLPDEKNQIIKLCICWGAKHEKSEKPPVDFNGGI